MRVSTAPGEDRREAEEKSAGEPEGNGHGRAEENTGESGAGDLTQALGAAFEPQVGEPESFDVGGHHGEDDPDPGHGQGDRKRQCEALARHPRNPSLWLHRSSPIARDASNRCREVFEHVTRSSTPENTGEQPAIEPAMARGDRRLGREHRALSDSVTPATNARNSLDSMTR